MLKYLVLILCCLAGSLGAQDFVKLNSGERIRGEVRRDSDKEVVLIDKLGQRLRFDRKDVASVKRGRPLKKKTQKRLEGLDAADSAALHEVVVWAVAKKGYRRDAEILARRLLVLAPDHAEARELLGHVKWKATWYEDAKARQRAISEEMKAKGLVSRGEGWIDPLKASLVDAAPKDWMVDEQTLLWRPVREVMLERGMIEWLDVWYKPEEERVVDDLKACQRVLGLNMHGAQVAKTAVLGPLNRKLLAEHVLEVEKARQWFIETYRPQDRRRIEDIPITTIVMKDIDQARAFIKDGVDRLHDATKSFAKFCEESGALSYSVASICTHQERGTWRHDGVARVGSGLMGQFWTGRSLCPDWIDIAAGHLAEFAVFGKIETVWVAPSKYGNEEQQRIEPGRTIVRAKKLLIEDYKKNRVATLRSFFKKRTNQMNATDDSLGVVLMNYFLEEKKEAWLDFLYGSLEQDLEKRAKETFGKDYPGLEAEFRKWLGV